MSFDKLMDQYMEDMARNRNSYFGTLIEKYERLSVIDCDVVDIKTYKFIQDGGYIKGIKNRKFGSLTKYKCYSGRKSSFNVLKKEACTGFTEEEYDSTSSSDEDAQSSSILNKVSVSYNKKKKVLRRCTKRKSLICNKINQDENSSSDDDQSASTDNEMSVSSNTKKEILPRCTEEKSLICNKIKQGAVDKLSSTYDTKDCFVKFENLDMNLINGKYASPESVPTFNSKNELSTKFKELDIKGDKNYSDSKNTKSACKDSKQIVQSKNKLNETYICKGKDPINENSHEFNILFEKFDKTYFKICHPETGNSTKYLYSKTKITLHKKIKLNANYMSNSEKIVNRNSINSSSLYAKCKNKVNTIERSRFMTNPYKIPDNKISAIDTFSKKSADMNFFNNISNFKSSSIKPLPCVPFQSNRNEKATPLSRHPNSMFNTGKFSLHHSKPNHGFSKLVNGNTNIEEDFKLRIISPELLKSKVKDNNLYSTINNPTFVGKEVPLSDRHFGNVSKSISSFKFNLHHSNPNHGFSKLVNGNTDIEEDFKLRKINPELLKSKVKDNNLYLTINNPTFVGKEVPLSNRHFGNVSKSISSFNSKYIQNECVKTSGFNKIKRKEFEHELESHKHVNSLCPQKTLKDHSSYVSKIRPLPCPLPSFRQRQNDKEKINRKLKGMLFQLM